MGRSVWNGGLNPPGLIVERQSVVDGVAEVSGRVSGAFGRCPDCGTASSSCHSRYVRTLSDLPISGAMVKLRLSVRRFRCGQLSCQRKTFSETLAPSLGRRHGRRVARCDGLLHAVALALGGRRGTIVAWLKENRQVRVICRDRGPGYGAAAAEAAPQARQVADRWHLFENASAAFLSAVRSELPRLRKALSPETPVDPVTLSKAERIGWEAAVTREAVNDQILALAAQGVPLKAMARTTGVSRQTIRKIVRGQRHDMFRTRQSSLDPWRVRLEAEWTGGCRNGAELWRRLQASGFAGSLRVVGEWATRRRRDDRLGQTAGPSLSARTIARGLTAERAAGSARIALVNATIETAAPDLIAARDLLDHFHAMMRSKDEAGLDPWIASAKHSKLASFAAGIEADRNAVAAAIVEPWSSGQVEGKINRLKLIKRQMYGRANLDLLKARLMARA